MKISKTKKLSKKKTLLIVSLVSLLVTGGILTYVYGFKGSLFGWSPLGNPQEGSINYDKPTTDQKQAGDSIKEQTITDKANPGPTDGDSPMPPVPQPEGKSKIDLTITSPDSQSGTVLQIHAVIGTLTNSGNCSLTLQKGDKIVTRTAEVQALASESTCKGFDIPMAELTPGSWQVILHFENDKLQGDTKQNITIK